MPTWPVAAARSPCRGPCLPRGSCAASAAGPWHSGPPPPHPRPRRATRDAGHLPRLHGNRPERVSRWEGRGAHTSIHKPRPFIPSPISQLGWSCSGGVGCDLRVCAALSDSSPSLVLVGSVENKEAAVFDPNTTLSSSSSSRVFSLALPCPWESDLALFFFPARVS